MKKTKVLFFAEGATLAHVARPLLLAKGLDSKLFDVTLCRPREFSKLTTGLPFPVLELDSQDGAIFARKLKNGSPLYDFPTLCRYVDADIALMDEEKPDVVVGDFRLSLSVSARLKSIPYITICDAYWSAERPLKPALPVFKFTRYSPIALTEFLFGYLAPLAFRLHARPIEKLRARFRLPSLGYDLRRCYTDADLRLFANFPALFPEISTNSHANFIGPIAWSPELPCNFNFIEKHSHLTYVTMGSSGNPNVIERIIPILEELGSQVIVATAGKPMTLRSHSSNTHIFDYLPGAEICKYASLVICNGGSPTTNQALTHGVPVLGIARNMDQFLNMRTIVNYGAGLMLRADRTSPLQLRLAIEKMMHDPLLTERARVLASTTKTLNSSAVLAQHIRNLTATGNDTGSYPR